MDCSKIDQRVKTFLDGLDLNDYIPLFDKYEVNFELFKSLTEEDLRTMGLQDEDHIARLLRCVDTLQSTNKITTSPHLTLEEVHEGMRSIGEHLKTIDAGISYVCDKIQPKELKDQMVGETTLTGILEQTIDHIKKTNAQLETTISRLYKEEKKSNHLCKIIPSVIIICALAGGFAVFNRRKI